MHVILNVDVCIYFTDYVFVSLEKNIYSEEIECEKVDLGAKSQKREHMPNGKIIAVPQLVKISLSFL